MLSMTDAVILAGGRGTRLAAVLPDGWPKTLAPIRGRPFLAYLLEDLYQRGVRRVTLCLGYGAAHVEEFLARHRRPEDLSVHVAVEPRPLGTAGALREAMAHVRSDPFLALNGDTYSDTDLDDLLASHIRWHAQITVALARVGNVAGYGEVDLDADGRITRFSERAQSTGRGFVNAGIYAINAAVISGLPREGFLSLERDVLPRYAGHGLFGRMSSTWFVDIGTPESLRHAADSIADHPAAAR